LDYQVKLPAFEGPFDLLFHLIQKQQIDIWSISVSEITEQYLNHLKLMEELNLEISSEFLVMAAALLRLKSKMLLPESRSFWEEEDGEEILSISSTEDLIRRVLEYRLYKGAAEYLQEREQNQQKIYFRSSETTQAVNIAQQEIIWSQAESAATLASLFRELEDKMEEVETGYSYSLMEEYDLRNKMNQVIKKLSEARQALYFNSLLEKRSSSEMITTFFALLELVHQSMIRVYQDKEFGPILIELEEKTKKTPE